MENETWESTDDGDGDADGGGCGFVDGASARRCVVTKTDETKNHLFGETVGKISDTKKTMSGTVEGINEKRKAVVETVHANLSDTRHGKRILNVDNLTLVETIFVITLSLCMAFSAGYSNGVALSGFLYGHPSMGVAGITNLYTTNAIALGDGDMDSFKFDIGIIFSSMAGSCLSGVLNPRPVAFVLSPRYGPTFLIGAAFAFFACLAKLNNQRREFYFMTFANGMMNAVTSMYSANLIRTTSYTGPTTDIGMYLGQLIRGNKSNLWRLYILSGLTTSFGLEV